MTTSIETSAERTLQLAERVVSSGPRRPRGRFSWGEALAYLLLSLGVVVMVTPFVWMLLTSFKTAPELLQFAFWPQNPTFDNYIRVMTTSSFGRWYVNSVLVAVISTSTVIFFDSLGG